MSPARRARVLAVDDDPGIRAVLTDTLADEGYEVRTAEHGAAALAVVGEWQPDVILLDINMPVMDGYAFASAYRERGGSGERGSHQAPIVVITAGERLPQAAERVGAVGYVPKPFDLDALLDTVQRHAAA